MSISAIFPGMIVGLVQAGTKGADLQEKTEIHFLLKVM
jgi:type III secretory pathway component EscS